MDRATLSETLLAAEDPARAALLAAHPALADAALAATLRTAYFDCYSSDPGRAAAATAALSALAAATSDPAVQAEALWVAGLAALQLEGRLELALERIDAAVDRFTALGQHHTAAATQVGKVFALARLGRYDEALATGRAARAALLAHGDELAAGRIELNLGNLAFHRDLYGVAERYYRAARARFAAAGELRMLAYVDNGLGNVLSRQLRVAEATERYEQALAAATACGLEVTQAEIECNLGGLALFQSHYDQALELLERSRRRYAALQMPHESAVAELELGDAYMELNMAAEAAAIYARVGVAFAELGMHAELARTLLQHGRACLHLGDTDQAWILLAEADQLFAATGNRVGSALVALAEAQLAFRAGDYGTVAVCAARAEAPLRAARAWEQLLALGWLAGEAARLHGDSEQARERLEATLADAEAHGAAPIALRCHTSLGRLAAGEGDRVAATTAFQQAIAIGERMRAPLPADEIRAAVAPEYGAPYAELTRLCLDDPHGPQAAAALAYAEGGRARAMVELLSGAVRLPAGVQDGADAADRARLDSLRAELNWIYSRMGRLPGNEDGPMPARSALYVAAREREAALNELRRRLSLVGGPRTRVATFALDALQADLGADSALVEYLALDGRLVAFVVTDEEVQVIRDLGPLAAIQDALAGLQFQIGALSHGAPAIRDHLVTLTARTRQHLAALYQLLLAPVEPLIGARRLVVVPYGPLHYVPFHALYAGGYLVERREVCCVPSAAVLHSCLAHPRTPLRRALLLGVAAALTSRPEP